MNWFNFFKKKTKDTLNKDSEDNDLLASKEKLGVFVHVGQGNYVLVLAPFWNENLILEEGKWKQKIVAIIILNGLKEGNLPLEKIFKIHQINSEIPIYLAALENANGALKKLQINQLPENFNLGITNFYFQKGTNFIQVKINRTPHSAALNAYIGINIQYECPQLQKGFLNFEDTWFIGNFDAENSAKTFGEMIELATRGKIVILQFRDWIKANQDKHLEAFSRMGWQGYFMGQSEMI